MKNVLRILRLCLLHLMVVPISCFSSTQRSRSVKPASSSSSRLRSSSKRDHDLPEINVRLFLTQRTIQSFLHLLVSMNDVHTLKWMDDFTQPVIPEEEEDEDEDDNLISSNNSKRINVGWVETDKDLTSKLLHYHGTEAINTTRFPTWDSYFEELVQVPATCLTISTPINPLVPNREFEIEIHPPRLCARILSVREQIANEWATKDLDVIGSVGFDIFYSYWETVKKNGPTTTSLFERHSKLFMDTSNDDVIASPLRIDNFDLLYNLATQESIHRVLEQGISVDQDDDGVASTAFLLDFYRERLDTHFRGNLGQYGRGDDFVEELMHCTPRMVMPSESASSSSTVIVNPVTIAEVVLKMREKVAADWKEIAKNASQEHFEIRKLMLDKMV